MAPTPPVASGLDRFCERIQPYDAVETDAARFRARQIAAVLKLTPLATVINVVNAAVLTLTLRGRGEDLFLYCWMSGVTLLAALGLRGWWRSRQTPRQTASRRAIRQTVYHALVLGTLWGLLPLFMFPRAGADGQSMVGMVAAGMMGAGAFGLASVPLAGTMWTLAIGLPSSVALLLSPEPLHRSLLVLLVAYMVITVLGVWNAARTLGARLMAEARADHQHEVIGLLLRDFEDQSSDLLWELDREGRFSHASRRLMQQFDLDAATFAAHPALDLLAVRIPDTAEARECWQRLRDHLASGTAFRDLLLAVRSRSGVRWWSLSARLLLDEQGAPIGWRGVAADHTERQQAHQRLAWLAHNDALTGLVNRVKFRDTLQALVADRQRRSFAVVYLDLDGFKQINDQLGHAAGDQLLQTVGSRLRAGARQDDTVARLGGDEFALLLRDLGTEAEVRPVLDRVLEGLAEPCQLPQREVPLQASLGVALSPRDGTDIDALMSHADLALYTAKHEGGGGYCFFHPDLAESGRRRGLLANALRGSLERGEFRVEYQPQIDTRGWAVCGFEALLRWHHAEYGEVAPSEFIPIAESIGLMPQLGEWVLTEACQAAASWPSHLSVSVNVSAVQLRDDAFLERILRATTGVMPRRVELEVTESALLDDITGAVAMLQQLRARGFRVALDDFGTGYSALSYLRRFPFDVLKIDRSFVRDLLSDQEALVIVETILAMSHALNMTTVAEGVESIEEAEMLRQRGCTVLQGYFVSPAMPASAVVGFAREWAARDDARLRLLPTG